MTRLLSVVMVLACIAMLPGRSVRAQAAAPRFVPGACGFHPGKGFTAGKNLECGDLLVPQDPTSATGLILHLRVAIFRTPSPHRMSDPVVFLQGGPGGAIVKGFGESLDSRDAMALMGNHDLILIDQRGTGLSTPALTCPEVDREAFRAYQLHLRHRSTTALLRKGYAACHARFLSRGINPADFTTLRDADDIAGLRIALNLPEMDVYSVSYGTRVALDLLKYYPTGIRSVVLDSIVTPQFDVYTDAISAEGRAFNALFAGCARTRHCRQKYPNLRRVFSNELTKLNRDPLKTGQGALVQRVNGYDFAQVVRQAMYTAQLLHILPRLMQQVNHRQTGLLSDFFSGFGGGGINTGVYQSVQCAEDAPRATPAEVHAAAATLPAPIQGQTVSEQFTELRLCHAWNVSPVPASAHDPVLSPVPTMLMGGEYDPITPPENVAITATGLTHSYGFVYPGVGHGSKLSRLCPDSMANAFFDDPTHAPSGTCIAHMPNPMQYS